MTKYPTKDYNLGVLYPHLIDEFHPTLNEKTIFDYTSGSHQKVYWICKKHDHYFMTIRTKTNGSNCPYCSGNKIWKEEN